MSRYPHNLNELESILSYTFRNKALLMSALTHVSALPRHASRETSYQRLEFLGDRVLGHVVAHMLYCAFPNANEGELSRRLANLVRRETCADVAQKWNLSPYIRLGAGESQGGGRKKVAILSDVCEAIIGAVFLDGGMETAHRLIVSTWEELMYHPTQPLHDPKTSLQEWAQARGYTPPIYEEMERRGSAHAPLFRIRVTLEGQEPAEALAPSKRQAEHAAAHILLDRVLSLPPSSSHKALLE